MNTRALSPVVGVALLLAITVEAVENTDELIVRSPASNACSGEKRLGAAGSQVEFTFCSPGDRFTVVAETDSTTTLIKEYTIPNRE